MVVPVLRKTGGSKPLPTHYVLQPPIRAFSGACLSMWVCWAKSFRNVQLSRHYTARKVTLLRRVLATSSVAGLTPSLGIVQIKPKQANEKGTQY
jgi:hypothetical protein